MGAYKKENLQQVFVSILKKTRAQGAKRVDCGNSSQNVVFYLKVQIISVLTTLKLAACYNGQKLCDSIARVYTRCTCIL